jgi:hyperosmotically inducible periplasmic protein
MDESPMRGTEFHSVASFPRLGYVERVIKPIKPLMKTYSRSALSSLLLVLGLGSAVLATGCAGTATKESTGEYLDNSAITARVKTALVEDEMVKGRAITVESFRGTVQLSGFVNTADEKARAERIASGIAGVQKVENNITVK